MAATRHRARCIFRSLSALSAHRPHPCNYTRQRGIITTSIPRIPKPTPFVPDVTTFLTLIGRNLRQHADKISSWNDLFSLTTSQFRDLGVEPPRTRRYLLRWLDRFRNGQFGLAGEAKFVEAGKVECRLVEVDAKHPEVQAKGTSGIIVSPGLHRTPGKVRRVLNVPYSGILDESASSESQNSVDTAAAASEAADGSTTATTASANTQKRPAALDTSLLKHSSPIEGIKYNPGYGIAGSYVRPVKGTQGSVAIIEVTEGMWEDRRHPKVDGGERRKAEVRAKRRAADRKAGRA